MKQNNIYFFYPFSSFNLRNRSVLKDFLASYLKSRSRQIQNINYVFCSDKSLLKINKQFLNHNFLTDIITFTLSYDPKIIDAEIYISIERVKANAQHIGVSFKSELHRVIFHGLLHLCGFNDKTSTEKAEMTKQEDYLLLNYFKKIKYVSK